MKQEINRNRIWRRALIACICAFAFVSVFTVIAVVNGQNTAQNIPENRYKPELMIQTGHTDSVQSVAISPDGKTLASGSEDNTIKLWNTETGQQIKSLEGHSNQVSSVTFSSDGKTLASGGWDKTIKLWNTETGQQIKSLEGSSDWVLSVAFSPNGKTLASGNRDKTIKLWNIETGQQIKSLEGHTAFVDSVAFSQDGKTLASADGLWKTIKLWNIETGEQLKSLTVHSDSVDSVALSPDGKTLVSGLIDHTIKLWNVETGVQLKSLEGHSDRVYSVEFSPDGKTLASVSGKTIKLWNVETGEELKSLEGHSNQVSSVTFSPDGNTLASGEWGKTIKLWNVETGEQLKSFEGYASLVKSVAFSPDGKTLVSGSSDKTIKLWNVETGVQIKSLEGHSDSVDSVAFSPDGKTLASVSGKTIKLWNVETGEQLKSLEGHDDMVSSVAFSPDGKTLASGSVDHTVKLWNVKTGVQIKSLAGLHNNARNVRDFKSKLQSKSLAGVTGFNGSVQSLAFSPDGKILASADGGVKLWNVKTGVQIKSLIGGVEDDNNLVNLVAFSPDGKTLASGSSDKTIKLWNVETGEQLKSLEGHVRDVWSVEFSPDGKTLASGSEDKTIKLWNVETGQQVKSLEGHVRDVWSVVFSPDGNTLASGSGDGTIKLWDKKSNKSMATLISLDKDDWVVVTPDGLFDGSPNAWKLLSWRLSERLYDIAPVESFFKEFYYPGLLQEIMQGKTPRPPERDLSTIDIRQPSIKITEIDGKVVDSSTKLSSNKKTAKVKVEITDNTSKPRSGVSQDSTSNANDLRLFRNGSLVRLWKKVDNKSKNVNDKQDKPDESVSVFELTEKEGCRQIPATKDSPRKAVCETDVQITAGRNEFTAYAFNHDNVKSSDASAEVTGADSLKRDGTLYILAVGVNKYENKFYNLNYAVKDVVEIGEALKIQQAALQKENNLKQYAKTEVITLTDELATKENILNALGRFSNADKKALSADVSDKLKAELNKIKPTQPEDALVIYFAGHGVSKGNRFYLLPHNFTGDANLLKEQSVSDLELNDYLETVDAGKILMTIDACQSGQALGGKNDGKAPMNSKGFAQLAYDKGMFILTAAQSQEAALEAVNINGKTIENGLLTYTLLQALKSVETDKDGNGQIREREWFDYATQKVPQLQLEAMKQRSVEIKKGEKKADGKRKVEIFYNPKDKEADPNERRVQTPRIFYKRETSENPFIVAKP